MLNTTINGVYYAVSNALVLRKITGFTGLDVYRLNILEGENFSSISGVYNDLLFTLSPVYEGGVKTGLALEPIPAGLLQPLVDSIHTEDSFFVEFSVDEFTDKTEEGEISFSLLTPVKVGFNSYLPLLTFVTNEPV